MIYSENPAYLPISPIRLTLTAVMWCTHLKFMERSNGFTHRTHYRILRERKSVHELSIAWQQWPPRQRTVARHNDLRRGLGLGRREGRSAQDLRRLP